MRLALYPANYNEDSFLTTALLLAGVLAWPAQVLAQAAPADSTFSLGTVEVIGHREAAASVLSTDVVDAETLESDPCTRFTWDVSQELAVMKQSPQAIGAAAKPGNDAPQLQIGKLYDLALAPQSGVTFAITPGKPTLADGAQAGLVRFRTDKAGRYRVAMTSGHWIDLVDGKTLVKSRDFQGARGCERPRKIVEFDLPAGRELTLQLSGASDATIAIAVTVVSGTPAG